MLKRSVEREQAFILLFEKSFNAEVELAELYDMAVENEVIEDGEFTKALLLTAWKKVEEIDAVIEKNSKGWKIGRISKVSLAVLRLAICEILYMEDIPAGVSINEAVELCKKYAANDEPSFVNGILGTVAKEVK